MKKKYIAIYKIEKMIILDANSEEELFDKLSIVANTQNIEVLSITSKGEIIYDKAESKSVPILY